MSRIYSTILFNYLTIFIYIQPFYSTIQLCCTYIQLFKDCISGHYQEKSSAPESKGSANPQMYHSFQINFIIFCCVIFYSITLIVLCNVNHLKSRKGAKFFKIASCSSTKCELRIDSADFEVEENDQIISEKQRPLALRA